MAGHIHASRGARSALTRSGLRIVAVLLVPLFAWAAVAPTRVLAQAAVPVRIDGEPGLTVHDLVGSVSGFVTVDQWRLVCAVPCVASLSVGTHVLGVGRGIDSPIRASAVSLGAPARLSARYSGHGLLRALGVLVMLAGAAVGTALVVFSVSRGDSGCRWESDCAYDHHDWAMAGGGVAVLGASMLGGFILLLQGDSASVDPVS